MQWYIQVLKKYATFRGRASRREYWWFMLIHVIILMASIPLDKVLGTTLDNGQGIIGSLYNVAMILPAMAVGVRRLHDTGRSGFWLLVSLVPFIGGLILFYFTCQASSGPNKYGDSPALAGE